MSPALLLPLLLPVVVGAVNHTPDPAREVAVLVNEAVPESVELGEYYCARRGVPLENICRLRTSADEEVDRPTFEGQILGPVQAFLAEHPDVIYLVPTWGVPVKVREQTTGDLPEDADSFTRHVGVVDAACVDRELELARREPGELEGWVANPIYGQARPITAEDRLLVVMRLDGPTPEAARGLVDLALHGETYGVEAPAFLDTRGLTGDDGYSTYDAELRRIAGVFAEAGQPLEHDDAGPVVDLSTREDLGHYWGWYRTHWTAEGEVRFAPGAVACHVHSFSAATVRSADRHWVGPLVANGATVALGTVYEPLTAGFPTAPAFWSLFLSGHPVGEALTLSNRFTSWMIVYLGDPLYAPYSGRFVSGQEERRDVARRGHLALEAALDRGDLQAARDWAARLAELTVPLRGAADPTFLVRELRARERTGDAAARGTVAQLRDLLRQGQERYAAGDLDGARSLAEQALELSPHSFEGNLLLGRALLGLGRRKAHEPLLEAVETDPDDVGALSALAAAYLAGGGDEEALDAAQRAGDRGLMGQALLALGRHDEALALLEAAATARPGDRPVVLAMGRALIAAGRPGAALGRLRNAAAELLPATPGEVDEYLALLTAWAEAARAARDASTDEARAAARALGRLRLPTGRARRRVLDTYDRYAEAVQGELPSPPRAPPLAIGPARVWAANERPVQALVILVGPGAYALSMDGQRRGRRPRPQELEVFPGVYELLVVEGEGDTRRIRARTVRLAPGEGVSLGLDPDGGWLPLP
jgi:uncharacterized protein (TIGR03790 family)